MNDKKMQKQRNKVQILYVIYLVAISYIILFKFNLMGLSFGIRSLNLIPYGASSIVNGQIDFSEIVMNILIFVPFGIFCGILGSKKSFLKKCLPFFYVSLTYEVLQYILGIGSTDITDLINNTLGGILGVLLYLGLVKLVKNEYQANKIVLFFALVGTIGMLTLVALLLILN